MTEHSTYLNRARIPAPELLPGDRTLFGDPPYQTEVIIKALRWRNGRWIYSCTTPLNQVQCQHPLFPVRSPLCSCQTVEIVWGD